MKDNNIDKIKDVVKKILPESKIIIFGSRARNEHNDDSDYDILIIIREKISIQNRRRFTSIIRKSLVRIGILCDVLIRSEFDVNYYIDKIGSITRIAVSEGITI